MIMNRVESRDSQVKWSYLVSNEVETEINMINEGMGTQEWKYRTGVEYWLEGTTGE